MRVLLADAHAGVRRALRLLLQEEANLDLVGEAGETRTLLLQARLLQPDLVLLDWELPGQPTVELLPVLHILSSQPKVIALSGRFEAQRAALAAGVDAFVSKGDPPERLLATLRTISKNSAAEAAQ